MGLERCEGNRDAIQIGVSTVAGITGIMAAEAFRIANPENDWAQFYNQNGEASRIVLAVIVAVASYCVLEEHLPARKEDRDP